MSQLSLIWPKRKRVAQQGIVFRFFRLNRVLLLLSLSSPSPSPSSSSSSSLLFNHLYTQLQFFITAVTEKLRGRRMEHIFYVRGELIFSLISVICKRLINFRNSMVQFSLVDGQWSHSCCFLVSSSTQINEVVTLFCIISRRSHVTLQFVRVVKHAYVSYPLL